MAYQRTIIITGGAGFIGSHVVRLFVNKYPEYKIINLDKLTYAGNLANLKDIEDNSNYEFVKMDRKWTALSIWPQRVMLIAASKTPLHLLRQM